MPDKIQHIIEKQASRWEHDQGQATGKKPPLPWGNVICIAREIGAGSTEVAEGLRKRLGFEVYDRKLLHEISERAHIREQLLESIDEHVRGGLSEFLTGLFTGDDAHVAYEQQLAEVVLGLAHMGNCIIVGRGATFLIPREHSLSVRLVASRDVRLRRFAEQRSLSEAQVGILLDQTQHELDTFVHKVFGRDPHSNQHYDLVLDSSTLPLPVLVDVIETAFLGKFPGARASAARV